MSNSILTRNVLETIDGYYVYLAKTDQEGILLLDSILSGVNTGDETTSTINTILTTGATTDTTISDSDYINYNSGTILKKLLFSSFKSILNIIYGALASANVWSAFQKFSEGINIITGKFGYIATSATADTINDIRIKNNSGSTTIEKCTVANATKGLGTWKIGKLKSRLERSVLRYATASSVTMDVDNYDTLKITALAGTLAINNPTGTVFDMQELLIYIKDNGTLRSLSFGTSFSGVMATLPTTTVFGKQMILYFVYNTTTVKWELINKSTQI